VLNYTDACLSTTADSSVSPISVAWPPDTWPPDTWQPDTWPPDTWTPDTWPPDTWPKTIQYKLTSRTSNNAVTCLNKSLTFALKLEKGLAVQPVACCKPRYAVTYHSMQCSPPA